MHFAPEPMQQQEPASYHEHYQYEQHHNMKGSVSSPSLHASMEPPAAHRGVSESFAAPGSTRSSPGLPTRTISNTRKAPEPDADFFASFGVK